MNLFPLYDVERMPIIGMFPTLEHSRIPQGGWKNLENVRLWFGSLGVRRGSKKVGALGLTFDGAVSELGSEVFLDCEDATNDGTLDDASGNGRHASVSGSYAVQQASPLVYETTKHSVHFAAATATISYAAALAVKKGVIFITCKLDALQNATLAAMGDGTTGGWKIETASDGTLTVKLYVGGTARTYTSAYEALKWFTVAIGVRGSELSVSFDGAESIIERVYGEISYSGTPDLTVGPFTGFLGRFFVSSARLRGSAVAYYGAIPLRGFRPLGCHAHSVRNGEDELFVAYFYGNSGRVYRLPLSSGSVAAEVTTLDNGFGVNTRLMDGAEEVSMTTVANPDGGSPLLMIAHPHSAPRFWDGSKTHRHERIQPPRLNASSVTLTGTGYIDIDIVGSSYGRSSTTGGGTGWSYQEVLLPSWSSAGTNGNAIKYTVLDYIVNGAWVRTRLTATDRLPLDATDTSQLWLVFRNKTGGSAWLNSVKIEVASSPDGGATPGTWHTIHDPTLQDSNVSSAVVPISQDDWILACNVEHITGTDRQALHHIRFVWADNDVGGAGATLYEFGLLGFIAGGQIQGFTRWAASLASDEMKSESRPIVLNDPGRHPLDLLGSWLTSPLPESERLFYKANINVDKPGPQAQLHRVNKAKVYRMDYGETDFYFVYETRLVSGAWDKDSDNLPRAKKDYSKRMPSEFSHGVPVCGYLESIGGRLWAVDARDGADEQPIIGIIKGNPTGVRIPYAGGLSPGMSVEISGVVDGDLADLLNGVHKIASKDFNLQNASWDTIYVDVDTSGASASYTTGAYLEPARSEGRVMFSRYRNPFEFSRQVQILPDGSVDDDSPGEHVFAGEIPITIEGLSQAGIDAITIWTNKNSFILGGSTTSIILRAGLHSPHGMVSRHGSTKFLTNVFWVDWRGFVYGGGVGSGVSTLSGRILDNVFDPKHCSLAYFDEKLFLSAVELSTKKNVFYVYDFRSQAWTKDTYPFGAGILAVAQSGGQRHLLNAAPDGNIYRLEVEGLFTDDGSSISILLESRRVAPFGLWDTGSLMRTLMVVGPGSGTMTVIKTAFPDASSATGQLALSSSQGAVAYEKSTLEGGNLPAVMGNGAVFQITGAISTDLVIHGIYVEAEARTRQARTG